MDDKQITANKDLFKWILDGVNNDFTKYRLVEVEEVGAEAKVSLDRTKPKKLDMVYDGRCIKVDKGGIMIGGFWQYLYRARE